MAEVKGYKSETLEMIMKHLTEEAIEDTTFGDVIDFPFHLEDFAREMDEKLLEKNEVIVKLRTQLLDQSNSNAMIKLKIAQLVSDTPLTVGE